ncbi:endolytic transglycosylase MltG [Ammoniphilus sp. YIM 78166]|uniref:endolytic transglycosylase MltG n=1 Tax=Ammoniphilus sp. YIM 78166 TaxID=1644106 RepID=UPI00142F6950|nr:endolytic transglycosylase MltG [Ammoniphilus sp. YIM 78166]
MRVMTKAIVLLIIFGVIGVAGAYYYYQESLQPTQPGPAVVVDIPPGSSTQKIAEILEENNLIRDSKTFVLYVRQSGKGSQLKAGQYEFTPGESVDRLLTKMVMGDVYQRTIQFTIPEGWTVPQIASFLAEKGWVNEEKFLQLVNEGEFDFPFVRGIPNDKSLGFRLEGYLFPKTYEVREGATEKEIIERMLAQFQTEWDPTWTDQLIQKNMSIHEAVTLASIVEREVIVDIEQAKVAGVYFNRLETDMLLQADATVQYALGKQKDIVTYKDLELDHPYNTYRYKGLPPGPIASPGRAALHSVVEPEKHGYFFYVTKKDGSGEHYFSETYQQHLKNIALSKRANK